MKIVILLMAIMVMSCFSASTLDNKARANSKGKRQCRSPRGNHGSVLKHGCIQSTCINRKWTPTMRTDICCFKNKPNMPNTVIENIAGDCNTTTTISCTEGGQLSFTHSGGQVEKLAAEIADLKDQSAQQFTDLKELIEKHVEAANDTCNVTGSKLYLEENGRKFYGVPIADGTTIVEGAVADTCEAAGMRAVCPGDCPGSSARCEVVDFEVGDCYNPMYGLSKKLCNGGQPRYCPQMDGLFNVSLLKRHNGGECGIVSGNWCANGNDYRSGNGKTYYAYCVKQ